jgi:hypothetical protein
MDGAAAVGGSGPASGGDGGDAAASPLALVRAAAASKAAKPAALVLLAVVVLVLLWMAMVKPAHGHTPPTLHADGFSYSIRMSDAANAEPQLVAAPAINTQTAPNATQVLFAWRSAAKPVCTLTKASLVAQVAANHLAVSGKAAAHAKHYKQLATSGRFAVAGDVTRARRVASLWLTPWGLLVASADLGLKVARGVVAGQPLALTATAATLTSGLGRPIPSEQQQPLVFWNNVDGRLTAASDTTWPFRSATPVTADLAVVWSYGRHNRRLQFLRNADLRLVDVDAATGAVNTVLWTASGDVRTPSSNASEHKCAA